MSYKLININPMENNEEEFIKKRKIKFNDRESLKKVHAQMCKTREQEDATMQSRPKSKSNNVSEHPEVGTKWEIKQFSLEFCISS